jgi:hypothetical protein
VLDVAARGGLLHVAAAREVHVVDLETHRLLHKVRAGTEAARKGLNECLDKKESDEAGWVDAAHAAEDCRKDGQLHKGHGKAPPPRGAPRPRLFNKGHSPLQPAASTAAPRPAHPSIRHPHAATPPAGPPSAPLAPRQLEDPHEGAVSCLEAPEHGSMLFTGGADGLVSARAAARAARARHWQQPGRVV